MRSYPHLSLPVAATAVAVLAVALSGCSSGEGGRTTSSAPVPAENGPSLPGEQAGPGAIGVSPGGVTTRVDVPAESTEEQYAKACAAAKEWMAAKGGDPKGLFEPLLQELQSSAQSGPATFNNTWAQLSDAQRAAVIVAVQAASDGGCG